MYDAVGPAFGHIFEQEERIKEVEEEIGMLYERGRDKDRVRMNL